MKKRRRIHGAEPEIDWTRLTLSQTEHILQIFDLIFLNGTSQRPLPFPSAQVPQGPGMD